MFVFGIYCYTVGDFSRMIYSRILNSELENFIKIDNTYFFIRPTEWSLTILQYMEMYKIVVPRFCYHEALTIAGNCRMCMLELEGSPKPLIGCASTLIRHASYKTNSVLVRKARENVLEFLLVNHPLDCPICDQGGECDLQDQSYVFGSDRGRFEEIKRSVANKFFGPFIKTVMTRCIHCTRCIRFMDEIAKEPTIAMLGRGKNSEISLYNAKTITHYLSGNLIDICPVGALTAKPYASKMRPWELKIMESIDVLDSLVSTLRIDLKYNTVARILPKYNMAINDFWISDAARFMFDSFSHNRLTSPLLKNINTNLFVPLSWSVALSLVSVKSKEGLDFKCGEFLDLISCKIFSCLLDYTTTRYFLGFDRNLQASFFSSSVLSTTAQMAYTHLVAFLELAHLPVLESKILQTAQDKVLSFNSSISSKSLNKSIGSSVRSFTALLQGKMPFSVVMSMSNTILLWLPAYLNIKIPKQINVGVINNLSYTPTEIHLYYVGFNYISRVTKCVNQYWVNVSTTEVVPRKNNMFLIFQGHHLCKNVLGANLILPTTLAYEQEGFYLNFLGWLRWTTQILTSYPNIMTSLELGLQLVTTLKLGINTQWYFGFFQNHFLAIKNDFEKAYIDSHDVTFVPLTCAKKKSLHYYLSNIIVCNSRLLQRMRMLQSFESCNFSY